MEEIGASKTKGAGAAIEGSDASDTKGDEEGVQWRMVGTRQRSREAGRQGGREADKG